MSSSATGYLIPKDARSCGYLRHLGCKGSGQYDRIRRNRCCLCFPIFTFLGLDSWLSYTNTVPKEWSSRRGGILRSFIASWAGFELGWSRVLVGSQAPDSKTRSRPKIHDLHASTKSQVSSPLSRSYRWLGIKGRVVWLWRPSSNLVIGQRRLSMPWYYQPAKNANTKVRCPRKVLLDNWQSNRTAQTAYIPTHKPPSAYLERFASFSCIPCELFFGVAHWLANIAARVPAL